MIQTFTSQLFTMTISQMKARYRNTFAGLIWVLLNPIIIFGIQSFSFKKILKIEVPDYYLYLLSGIVPWVFLTQSITMSINTFQNQGQLIKSFQINPLIIVSSSVLDNFFNFCIAFSLLSIPIIFLSSDSAIVPTGLFFFPIGLLLLCIATISLCFLLSMLQVLFQDLQYIIHFIFAGIFFVTPIFFPKEFMPLEYSWIIKYNIFYAMIEPIQISLYYFQFENFIYSSLKCLSITFCFIGLSLYYWNKKKDVIYVQI